MKNSTFLILIAPLQLHASQLALLPISFFKKNFTKGILMILAFILIMMTLQGCDKEVNPAVVSDKTTTLNTSLRVLWSDHAVWTRNMIFNFIDGAPGTAASVNRLLQNQVDLGNSIKPFYGEEAGDQLTVLLKKHTTSVASFLTAAKAGNAADYKAALADWQINGDDLAAFFNTANPENWKLAEWKDMMETHLDLTSEEAVARLRGDYVGDVAAYDNVYKESMKISDVMAKGLIAQFPDKM